MRELPRMTWRRFSVLVRCLSPGSATVARITSGQYIGGGRDRVNTVVGPKAAQAAFESIFKK